MPMKYAGGAIKSVYMLKFDHGDDMLWELQRFAKEKNIRSGVINVIGALEKGRYVEGPNTEKPLQPHWKDFKSAKEIVAIGTIFWKEGAPSIHMHGGFGGKEGGFVGCLREDSEVFLVAEAVIYELDIDATRKYDEETGLHLLDLGG
jgi:predicted DNA-binding protein with PD1-like motif